MADRVLVRDYLEAGHGFDDLLSEHGVVARPHNGKVSFTYHQLQAHDGDPLAQQCRGLILRESDLSLVAYPFDRFFNHGQGCAAAIDWSTAVVEDKLDGSLLIGYYDHLVGEWMCATRGCCEAQGEAEPGLTFKQLADLAAVEHGAKLFADLMSLADTGATYMFELTSPYNRIVCEYERPGLTLLGARVLYLPGCPEIPPELAVEELPPTIPTVKTYSLTDIDSVLRMVSELHPSEHEGVVVKDARFNRIKVKSPSYVAYNKLRDSLSTSWRGCVEIVTAGKADDVLPMVPSFIANRLQSVSDAYRDLYSETLRDFTELQPLPIGKPFALEAKGRAWPAALFALKNGKSASLDEFAKSTSADNVLELLKRRGLRTTPEAP